VFGGPELVVIAGPCAVENEKQLMTTARAVKAAGAQVLRGGAYKPRTSPYSFQGLGKPALELLAQARAETGLPVITEVTDPRSVELVAEYADILQVGARNMQNYVLLQEVGRASRPVMLKRGLSGTLEELLMAAEYVAMGGDDRILLCERGMRTFERQTRNTLDLSAVPVLKYLSHLPVAVDPSHAAGEWRLVGPLAWAAAATGADAVMVEVHPNPEEALSDGPQALTLPRFAKLMQQLRQIPRYSYEEEE
jgi:3-deoxy-7-phosphoheptulonate synthase